MCGIVGYLGKDQAAPVLLDGLARLEYRGYDSAGVAVLTAGGAVGLRKSVGMLQNLSEELSKRPLQGNVGVGHTRWATHGMPSRNNSHPHQDCSKSIFVVHNGIIENFHALRKQLKKKGHRFASDTDSEVLAHLVEEELKRGAKGLLQATQRMMGKIVGAYALGIVRKQEPNVLVGVRSGSPLVYAEANGHRYLASDAMALLHRSRDVMYLEEGHVAEIRPDGCRVVDARGKSHPVRLEKISWDYESGKKGQYEKFMAKEIHEQPAVLERMLKQRAPVGGGKILLEDLRLDNAFLKRLSRVYIVSCGTAYYAGLVGKNLIERNLSISVEATASSEFRYRPRKLFDKKTLLIAVSQSGETADTLASVREARAAGCKVLSICNVVGSSIARVSDGVIYTHAGPEIAVASTKAYTAQLLAFHLLAQHMGVVRREISGKVRKDTLKRLHAVPGQIRKVLSQEARVESVAKKYYPAKGIFFVGRGINYPTALEAALKNKEISYMHSEGYPAGELKHGPIAMLDPEFLVVGILTKSPVYEKMISNIQEVQARKANVVLLANANDKEIRGLCEDILTVPEVAEEISPLINIVPLQLLAYHIARLKGCDIDKPRNLAKSVTVE